MNFHDPIPFNPRSRSDRFFSLANQPHPNHAPAIAEYGTSDAIQRINRSFQPPSNGLQPLIDFMEFASNSTLK